jgi:hypothetical protein
VIHEDPEALIPEMVSFVKPGGLAGIVDYDMKGVEFSIFSRLWGSVEKNEIEETNFRGLEECFAIHTRMGLEDYLQFFEKLGLKTKFVERKVTFCSNTYHFVYIGQKS